MQETMKIPITFQKIECVDFNDTRFTKVKIWLLHLNENFNGSYFEKPVVEEAIPSLSNTPILGYVEINSENEKDFSGHREVLVSENGEIKTKYLGKAIGVIPSDNNAAFEMRVCDDGIEREFLTVTGLLWTGKFDDVSEIMLRDKSKGQSIELASDYTGEFKDDKLFHFTSFRFYGACILGENVRPAMQNATIELTYSIKDFEKEILAKLEEYKNFMTNQEEVNKENANLESENLAQFSLTAAQLNSELANAVMAETHIDRWGDEMPVYSYYDHKDGEVYVHDRTDNWNLYGFTFTVSGDKVTVDFTSKRRKKLEVVDFEEGEAVIPTLSPDIFTQIASDKEKELNEENSKVYSAFEKEVETLKGQLAVVESEKKKELFAKYARLNGIDAFECLKNEAVKYTLDELTKEFKVIAFDNNLSFDKFSAEQQPETEELAKVNFSKNDSAEKSPYGDLFEQYLN